MTIDWVKVKTALWGDCTGMMVDKAIKEYHRQLEPYIHDTIKAYLLGLQPQADPDKPSPDADKCCDTSDTSERTQALSHELQGELLNDPPPDTVRYGPDVLARLGEDEPERSCANCSRLQCRGMYVECTDNNYKHWKQKEFEPVRNAAQRHGINATPYPLADDGPYAEDMGVEPERGGCERCAERGEWRVVVGLAPNYDLQFEKATHCPFCGKRLVGEG